MKESERMPAPRDLSDTRQCSFFAAAFNATRLREEFEEMLCELQDEKKPISVKMLKTLEQLLTSEGKMVFYYRQLLRKVR